MHISNWIRLPLLIVVMVLLSRSIGVNAALSDYPLAQTPLFLGEKSPPLMMMVMSRDEQLFNKAYSDYTDLDGDGTLETTYQDTFNYSGYFDPKLCYSYGSDRFKAAAVSGGTNGHSCSGQWSGNFLNWVTMSRLDVLRFVLYGGQRSTDAATTVLERANIPNDLHAWVKVYSGGDIGSFTPLSGTQSFCNASFSSGGVPQMRYATGDWSEWAATALSQCNDNAGSDTPASSTKLTVRAEVCDPTATATLRESFCQKYTLATVDSYKPTGLLQTYGESGRLRFGMVSGSYSKPRSGGLVRRNIGKIAGNGTGVGCAVGDEVDLGTGRFCNQTDNTEGVINTLRRYKLDQWNYSNNWNDCNNWGINNRQGGNGQLNNPGSGTANCSAWGNPLAEMYAEALRYIAGQTTASTAFTGGSDLTGMPTPTWTDPYRLPAAGGNSYCAKCSILVMSSGLPTFDSDEIPAVPQLPTAAVATDSVGSLEGITGNYTVGRVVTSQAELAVGASVNTHEDICTSKSLGSLSLARGLCPDIPSMEGSHLISGLAYRAFTTDLRPGLQGKPADYKNTVQTYAVALAENLPKFDIRIGTGTISLAPLCQSNASGVATAASTGWRSCFLGSVGVGPKRSSVSPNHVYGRPLLANGNAGSFSLVWEDSLWGNDHDNDVVSMLTYCIGAACNDNTNPNNTGFTGKDICWDANAAVCGAGGSPTVADNEVLVRIENLSAYAGNAMLTGFGISGSNNDGVVRTVLRPGNQNGSVLTTTAARPTTWTQPQVMKFTVGSSNARQLESPLWYAAKYGGFNDANNNGQPDAGEWDSRQPGVPDNYFLARDPTKLKEELERIFEQAAGQEAPTAGAGAGARINAGSFTIDASFNLPENSNDWTGNVRGLRVNTDGSEGAELWNAANQLPAPAARNIFVTRTPTVHNATGVVTTAVNAQNFTFTNVADTDAARRAALGMPATSSGWFAGRSGDDLVNYVKGLNTYEMRNGGGLRNRSSVLGDIINANPEIVSPRDDFGYGAWSGATTPAWKDALGDSYKAYLTEKSARAPMVYIGANDGMLHGFDASAVSGGAERLAFIPVAAREHLFQLANPNYSHRYYVDGGITVSDVPTTATGDWRSVLVGSTGAGGTSIFGLDISNPTSFDATNVRWELNGANQSDLGYVLGKPVIVPVNVGGAPRWVALFGNGVNSSSGYPVLFAVDVWTGEILGKLKPTTTTYGVRNGLMNIAPVALYNSNGLVDTVYGGDLQGNVWKFDLSSPTTTSWGVAFGGAPLFVAAVGGVGQPITGGIEVSTGPGGGVSLFFGTGRYFANGDDSATMDSVQSLYGIWDNCTTASCATNISGGRGSLVGQAITTGTASSGYQTRNISRNAVSYTSARGWYVDLTVGGVQAGERFIGTPNLQNGKVFFTTYEPSDATCSPGGGVNWLYGINLLTGGGGMSGVSVAPGGTSVCTGDCGGVALNSADNGAPPTRTTNIFIPPIIPCDPSDPTCTIDKKLELEQCTLVLRTVGANPLYLPRPCGRQSWRQVR